MKSLGHVKSILNFKKKIWDVNEVFIVQYWFFQNEEQGIILQDDCIPNVSFFTFCDILLERYRNDQKVGMICGYNVSNFWHGKPKEDYYFSQFPLIWGWASWKRSWKGFDLEMKNFPNQRKYILHKLRNLEVKRFWDYLYKKTYLNRIDTWDFQLNFHFLVNDFLCVAPKEGLITNIGFSNDATSTKQIPEFILYNKAKEIELDNALDPK